MLLAVMLKISKISLSDLVTIPIEEVTKLLKETGNHGSTTLISALH